MTPLRTLVSGLLPAFLAVSLSVSAARAQAPAAAAPAEPADSTLAPLPKPAPPPEYDLPPPGTRWSLLATGAAVTGVSYGLALGASYAWPNARTADELRIPVVGPWMAIADTGCTPDEPDCSTVLLVVTAILTGVDGVLQAGGIGVMIESAFLPTSSAGPRRSPKPSASPTVRPVPIVAGKDGVGLGLVGTF